jgi:hypothetical protein
MSDLISKFVEAQLSVSKSKPPTVVEPKHKNMIKMDARVVEPEEETAHHESLEDRFEHIIKARSPKKRVKEYLQDLINEILKDDD